VGDRDANVRRKGGWVSAANGSAFGRERSSDGPWALPEQLKARFESQRIHLVRYQGDEFAYAFADGNGEMTENEFGRRYRALTSSTELDSATG
jgi:hypothetical protein